LALVVSRQFVAFLASGGVAAAANILSRIVFSLWFDYLTAVCLAFLVGLVTGFLLARFFVFQGREHAVAKSAFYYVLVNLAALLMTATISVGLGEHFFPTVGIAFFPLEIAHAIGVIAPVFTSYIGHKKFTFK
jgi:putative flippase GtrA